MGANLFTSSCRSAAAFAGCTWECVGISRSGLIHLRDNLDSYYSVQWSWGWQKYASLDSNLLQNGALDISMFKTLQYISINWLMCSRRSAVNSFFSERPSYAMAIHPPPSLLPSLLRGRLKPRRTKKKICPQYIFLSFWNLLNDIWLDDYCLHFHFYIASSSVEISYNCQAVWHPCRFLSPPSFPCYSLLLTGYKACPSVL